RNRDLLERQRQRFAGRNQPVDRRPKLGLEAVALLTLRRAGMHLLADQRQEGLGRLKWPRFGEALRPAFARQHSRADQHRGECALRDIVTGNEILEPPPQAPRATPRTLFGADNPAPELCRLLAGERQRESAVGSIEDMMA